MGKEKKESIQERDLAFLAYDRESMQPSTSTHRNGLSDRVGTALPPPFKTRFDLERRISAAMGQKTPSRKRSLSFSCLID